MNMITVSKIIDNNIWYFLDDIEEQKQPKVRHTQEYPFSSSPFFDRPVFLHGGELTHYDYLRNENIIIHNTSLFMIYGNRAYLILTNSNYTYIISKKKFILIKPCLCYEKIYENLAEMEKELHIRAKN